MGFWPAICSIAAPTEVLDFYTVAKAQNFAQHFLLFLLVHLNPIWSSPKHKKKKQEIEKISKILEFSKVTDEQTEMTRH